jgi:methyl-accepting chemotaxis protein
VQSRSSVDIAAAIEEMSAGIAAVTDNALQAMQVAQDMQGAVWTMAASACTVPRRH